MKWIFYVIVFVYMFYRAVYGAKVPANELMVEPVTYGDEGFLKVGEHKTVSCKATYRNSKVEWLYPNGTLVPRLAGTRIFSQQHFAQTLKGRHPALVLTVTKALVEDTGLYQCRSGDLNKEISLCVIEPSEFVDTPAEVTADLGRSITLSCQAKGDPEPRLAWTRNGESISDDDSSGKYRVMTKYNIQGFEGLLTITSLEPEDSGVYTCESIQQSTEVEDCSHTMTYNVTLNVNYAPYFEDGNDTKLVFGKNNQEVDIECSAQGYPIPTYKLYKVLPDDTMVEADKKAIKLSEDGKTASLPVVASTTTFGQRYKCAATNDIGSVSKYFALTKLEKPAPISEVVLTEASDKAVKLNVTWDDEIVFPVTAFEIQYLLDQNKRITTKDPAWKRSKMAEVNVEDGDVDTDFGSISVTLTELEPDTSYWLRLRAKNEAGESGWSNPEAVTTSLKAESITTASEEEEEKVETTEKAEIDEKAIEANMNETTFYGIFFAGGIFVVAFVCMFAMRMVK